MSRAMSADLIRCGARATVTWDHLLPAGGRAVANLRCKNINLIRYVEDVRSPLCPVDIGILPHGIAKIEGLETY